MVGVEILASFSQSPQSQGYPMNSYRQKMRAFCLPNLPTGDSPCSSTLGLNGAPPKGVGFGRRISRPCQGVSWSNLRSSFIGGGERSMKMRATAKCPLPVADWGDRKDSRVPNRPIRRSAGRVSPQPKHRFSAREAAGAPLPVAHRQV